MLKSATAMVTICGFAILQQRMPVHAIEPTNLATYKRRELVRLGTVPVAVILCSTELKARAHLTTSRVRRPALRPSEHEGTKKRKLFSQHVHNLVLVPVP